MDRQRWEKSLRKARAILRETPEARARQQSAAEWAAAEARKRQAKLEVARMLERETAMRQIEQTLDELEDVASWLLYGKSRWSR